MTFPEELQRILPADLPHRDQVIEKTARHLELIEDANRHFNLTRIATPHEAAIKHVYDSVAPWRLFSNARHIVDAGTGAGFPGIPLALVLPDIQFTLAESIQKKARFVETAVRELNLPNIEVVPRRAEEIIRPHDLVTARAVAPISRTLALFPRSHMLLYKGPDAEKEIAELGKRQARARVVMRYELPEGQGTRTVVEIKPLA